MVSINVTNAKLCATALDVQRATYFRRWFLNKDNKTQIEQKFYAHRTKRNLLVTTMKLKNYTENNPYFLSLSFNRGNDSQDFDFQRLNSTTQGTKLLYGSFFNLF